MRVACHGDARPEGIRSLDRASVIAVTQLGEQRVTNTVRQGQGQMPAFPETKLSNGSLEALLTYLSDPTAAPGPARVPRPLPLSTAHVRYTGPLGSTYRTKSDLPAIGPVVWGSDGDQSGLITQSEPWDQAMAAEPPRWPVMTMDGNPVFKWAAFTMAKAAAEVLDRAGVGPEEIEVFVPHQANTRIIDAASRRLGIPMEKAAMVLDRTGNTSAASIPLALVDAVGKGRVSDGDILLLCGFGAGMTWASAVVRWGRS